MTGRCIPPNVQNAARIPKFLLSLILTVLSIAETVIETRDRLGETLTDNSIKTVPNLIGAVFIDKIYIICYNK